MIFEFPPIKQRQYLEPGFNPENPLHIKRFLDQLKSNPPNDFSTASVWYSLFQEGSVAINDTQASLELATHLDTTSQEARTRLQMFDQKVLSQLLHEREALIDIYLNSPWRSSMHADDNGKVARDLLHRKKFAKPELANLQIQENELIRSYRHHIQSEHATLAGQRIALPVLVGRMHSGSEETRKSAFLAYWTHVRKNESTFQDLFSELIENRQKQAQLVNETSYAPIAFADLGRTDYGAEECRKLRDSIFNCIVPELNTLSQKQAESLEHASVHPWNAGAWPSITPSTAPAGGDINRLLSGMSRVCESLHPAFEKVFTRMLKLNTLQVHPNINKAPGAFCITLQESAVPIIFANFECNTKDAMTLLHEFGHATHGHATSFIPNSLLRTPSMDFCELMSTGMEVLAYPHLKHWWENPTDARKAQASHLFGMLNFWPFMAMIDEWQHVIYTHPNATSHKFRNSLWKSLSQKYRPHLDWSECEEFEELGWFARPHIFTSPFYYIDYGIAQLGALQLWKMQRDDPTKAVNCYLKGLSLGAQRSLPELFEATQLKFDFSEKLISSLAKEIIGFLLEE